MPSTVGWSSCSPQRSAVQRLFWPAYCRTLVAVLRAPVYEGRVSVAYRFPRQRRCVRTADEPFTPTGVGSFPKNEENLRMKQKLIVRAVCLALALPAGMVIASPVTKAKPDTLLAVDMNRSAIIDGVIANWKSQLTSVQEKVLRDTLSTLRADRLMAASLAPSFDGLVAVLKSVEKSSPVSEKVNAKAAGGPDLVYVPVTPCR